ncbi:MAG: PEP-CTERM sorting domain-containing protein [Rhodanobacter sp.]|nr:MAG: PEP-CTERM sorting domain-containing protein [Rhodanobacter sp.]TAM00915.1 MAG: PEP-CTERM sorting domain-containing protein [Rhodanobacter sp.]TAM40868.1 MAG: PEP-CTERM sorting domain-containing protein [Rhodanobacter sp.]TAN25732.1 MAG: PEP-CTERM sorting domain-containing protein [Rhodanobacter sp.]
MLKKKYIGTALACALALGAWSGSTLATPINVDGITWNSSSDFDLTIQSIDLRESSVSSVGNTLMGYGQIGSINGNKSFCASCDLTFTFQYTVSNINGNQVVFNNGSYEFYVAPAGSFSFGNPTSASGGTPWVTLAGHTAPGAGFSQPGQLGQLYATIDGTTSDPTVGSGGFGLVDVMGGDAAPWLNSNTISDGIGGWADFNLVSSFLTKPAKSCTSVSSDPTNLCHYPIEGNGSLTGTTAVPVPEPGTAGLLGLGLAFLGLFTWWRRKEAEKLS